MTKMEKAFNERPQGALPSNTIPNPQEEVKVITTRSGMTLAGPSVLPPPPFSSSKEVERDPKLTIDQVHISSSENTARVPSPVSKSREIPKRNPYQPPIPYPSRLNKDKLQDNLIEALALIPKYAKILKDLLTNKEKLLEMANTPLNENCSVVILKKLPEKLGDRGKFLIPCDFSELEKCMALADLGASINLIPLSVWKKLMLPELVPTLGKFTFPADFVVVDYDVDSRVPLILGRPLLRMARSLVDVHKEELIMRVCDEKLTFKVDSTSKYSHKEKSSGNTTSQSDHSLPDYEEFCFDIDHHEEKSSGSTISHSGPSLLEYESFYFDLSIDPPPIVERSNSHHEEFADELAHIISPPECDHFYFDIEADPGELTRLLKENISSKIKEDKELKSKTSTKKVTIHELNDLCFLLSNCDSTFSEEFFEIDPYGQYFLTF
ncbi:reverse transcriptase domain-containing protein [Tanacetum coccineum]